MNRMKLISGAVTLIALAGCQSYQKNIEPEQQGRTAAQTLRVDRYYEMMMPGDTALRDVTDDGTNIYLDFVRPLPEKTQFFDADGQALIAVREGALVGVAGLHQGVLVKTPNGQSSFVSVRAGATREAAPQAANTPAVASMRERLVDQVAAAQAMKRALAAVAAKERAEQDAAAKAAADEAARSRAVAEQAALVGPAPAQEVPSVVSESSSIKRSDEPERSTQAMMRVFFDFDSYRTKIRELADRVLEGMGLMSGIEITGHTDSVGPAQYNLELGLRRARFVANRLVDEGVEPDMMTVESRGEDEPIASNATAEGRAKNRRVDIRLTP